MPGKYSNQAKADSFHNLLNYQHLPTIHKYRLSYTDRTTELN